MADTITLENGLRKVLAAPINEDGSYDSVIEIANLTQITSETAEGETRLPAGNTVKNCRLN